LFIIVYVAFLVFLIHFNAIIYQIFINLDFKYYLNHQWQCIIFYLVF